MSVRSKDFPNGNRAVVYEMTFGKGRICVGPADDPSGFDDVWCYESVPAAIDALEVWDGEGEPAGWMRHPRSGRRRPEGDPAQEYVRR